MALPRESKPTRCSLLLRLTAHGRDAEGMRDVTTHTRVVYRGGGTRHQVALSRKLIICMLHDDAYISNYS